MSIHPSDNSEVNSEKGSPNDETTEKLFRIRIPRSVPLNSERRTFFVYSAKAIAKSDGSNESAESSIVKTLLLKELNQVFQTFLCKVHTLVLQSL